VAKPAGRWGPDDTSATGAARIVRGNGSIGAETLAIGSGQSALPRREACDDKSSCRAIRRVTSADGRSDRLHRLLSDVGDDRHAIERLCRGCVDYLSVSGAGVSAGFFSWKRSPGLGAFSLPMTGARSHGPFSMSSRSYSRSNDSCGPIDSLAPDPGRPVFGRGRKGPCHQTCAARPTDGRNMSS
jgi:hypothetical protein